MKFDASEKPCFWIVATSLVVGLTAAVLFWLPPPILPPVPVPTVVYDERCPPLAVYTKDELIQAREELEYYNGPASIVLQVLNDYHALREACLKTES